MLPSSIIEFRTWRNIFILFIINFSHNLCFGCLCFALCIWLATFYQSFVFIRWIDCDFIVSNGNIGRAGRAAVAIVVLRLWKIIRAIHAVAHSISVKNHLLIKKIREAQSVIEEEKFNTEQMMEKQEIKLEYLINILKTLGKPPNLPQLDRYVQTTWQQRKTKTIFE